MANTAVRDSKRPSSIYRYDRCGYNFCNGKYEINSINVKKYKNLLNIDDLYSDSILDLDVITIHETNITIIAICISMIAFSGEEIKPSKEKLSSMNFI